MGPVEKRDARQRYGHKPEVYVEIFKKINVGKVIRLNDIQYNKNVFVQNMIDHDELFFTDGSTPPDSIVMEFMKIVDEHF